MTKSDCEAHEATHFHLSSNDYLMWKMMYHKAAEAERICGINFNSQTRQNLLNRVNDPAKFETAHNINETIKKPKDFFI